MPHSIRIRFGAGAFGATLLTLLIVGCGEPNPTAPSSGTEASLDRLAAPVKAASADPQELPFSLSGDAVFVGQDFAPGFGPPTFGRSDFGGRCSLQSDFVIRFSMTGQATDLGEFTGEFEHCVRVDFQAGLHEDIDGIATLTAANGDELWDRYGSSPGDPEDHRFVGGTGRFENASGGGAGSVVCDQDTGTCVFELEGEIVYDASDNAE